MLQDTGGVMMVSEHKQRLVQIYTAVVLAIQARNVEARYMAMCVKGTQNTQKYLHPSGLATILQRCPAHSQWVRALKQQLAARRATWQRPALMARLWRWCGRWCGR